MIDSIRAQWPWAHSQGHFNAKVISMSRSSQVQVSSLLLALPLCSSCFKSREQCMIDSIMPKVISRSRSLQGQGHIKVKVTPRSGFPSATGVSWTDRPIFLDGLYASTDVIALINACLTQRTWVTKVKVKSRSRSFQGQGHFKVKVTSRSWSY